MSEYTTSIVKSIRALGDILIAVTGIETLLGGAGTLKVEEQNLPLPTEEQNLPLPTEEQNLPLPVEVQNLTLPVEEQNLPLPVQEPWGVLTPKPVAAASDQGVIIAAPTSVDRMLVSNTSDADTFYLMVWDLPAVPVAGTGPTFVSPGIPPLTMLTIPLYQTMANGACWAASSTPDTYTAAGTAVFQVQMGLL
jgi:hypothetical protein